MTDDLEVARQVVNVAVGDLDAAGDAIGYADTFVHSYFTVQPGGRFLTQSSGLLANIRDSLGHQYLDVATKLDAASGAVQGIWSTFERTDAEARIQFEKAQRKYQQGSGPPPLTAPPPPIAPHPQRPPATASVDLARLKGALANPQADYSVLDALNTWGAIKDGVDRVLSFGWLEGVLQNVAIYVPLAQFRRWMEGNYYDMADAAAGFYALAGFFEQVDTDTHLTSVQITEHWSGRSADTVSDWVADFGGAARLHAGHLTGYGSAIQNQAQTAKLILDQILDLLDDLADCIPVIEMYGQTFIERAVELAVDELYLILRAISVAARLVVKLVFRLELLYDAVMLILTFITSCGQNLQFPPVTTPVVTR